MSHNFKIFSTAVFLMISFSCIAQETRKMHFGLVYPVSTNGLDAPKISNDFSLQLIGGVSKSEKGFAMSGIGNLTEASHGVMIAGVSNIVKDTAEGFHLAGLVNVTGKDSRAVEVAGLANITGGNSITQISGLSSVAKGEVKGIQLSGFSNYAQEAKTQIAGFSSTAKGNVKGVQLSGFVNYANEVNTQVAGFVNVAKKVKGVQIAGFINIADSSDYPIGLVNIIKNGEKSFSVSVDETVTTMATFRSGGKKLYGIVGGGYNLKFADDAIYGFEAGFGMNIKVSQRFKITPEMVAQNLFQSGDSDYFKSSMRALAVFQFSNHFAIFGGPTFNYVNYPKSETNSFMNDFLWENTRSNGDFEGLYFGLNGGIRLIL